MALANLTWKFTSEGLIALIYPIAELHSYRQIKYPLRPIAHFSQLVLQNKDELLLCSYRHGMAIV